MFDPDPDSDSDSDPDKALEKHQMLKLMTLVITYGVYMLIHDDIFSWEGFGGMFDLASGQCRLRIFDISKLKDSKVMHIKPLVVVVSDLPDSGTQFKKISVRSCTSHIATCVVRDFDIDPQRMVYLEYYPASTYGDHQQHYIPAKYDVVDFIWHDKKALHPRWRELSPPLLDVVSELISGTE